MALIYCFLDVEVDGPTPGANSMLGLGFAAYDEGARELDAFSINLDALEGASGARNVMDWWRTQPEAWAHIRCNPVLPADGMARCLHWLESLGSDLVLAAHPLRKKSWTASGSTGTCGNSATPPSSPDPSISVAPSSARAWMCRPTFRRL